MAALLVRAGVLVLELLHWSNEVVPSDDLEVPPAKQTLVNEREVGMAVSLIEGMTAKWNPDNLRKQVAAKGLSIVNATATVNTAEVKPTDVWVNISEKDASVNGSGRTSPTRRAMFVWALDCCNAWACSIMAGVKSIPVT